MTGQQRDCEQKPSEPRGAEESFRAFFDHAPIGKSMTAPDGRLLRVNRAFCELLGRSAEELAALDWAAVTHPDDIAESRECVRALLAGERDTWAMEKRYLRPDGRAVFAHVTTRLFRDAEGRPLHFLTHVLDLGERRRIEERLRESEARLARAHRIARLGDWEWNVASGTLAWSEEVYRIFGFARDTPLSFEGIVARIHPEDRERNQAFVDALLARDDRGELDFRVVGEAGELKHVHQYAEVRRGPDGRPEVIHGTMQDISALKRAEERLRASEARFRTIFDELTDGVLLADPATHALVLANRSISRMLGRSEQELLGLRVEDLHPPAELPRVLAAFERQRRGEGSLATDIPLLRPDGSVLYADVNATPVTLEGRELQMGVFRDATERRAVQARLAQQDRLASMGLLAAGVAHEINNPLSFMLYSLETLAAELPAAIAAIQRCRASLDPATAARILGDGHELFDPAGLEESVGRIRDALEGTRRIREIARTLSTFARVEQGELAPVSLHHAIDHAIRMAYNQVRFRARLVKDYGKPPPVLASEGKLAQVFLNLLLNAAHAIAEGDVEGNEIRFRTSGDEGRAIVEVSDTGRGIAPAQLDQIFEPFFTTKETGSGLGLPVCRHLVESFGGTIDCTSEPGRTCFRIVLPAAVPSAPPRPPTPVAAPAGRGGRILIVDDEPGIRSALARMLAAHESVLAASGAEARDVLARDRRFDLVLCDLMMPGLSGMDLHAWLAGVDAALAARMVFVTGGTFTPKAAEFLARVANPRLEKPLESHLVRGVVDALLSGRGGTRS